MLDSLRNATKTWVVKLLFALLVLSFLAWGVGDVVRGGLFGSGPAIKVGSTEISANEVNIEFKREVERLQPMFGGKLTAEDARKLGLMDRTIETVITRTLIDEAGRRLGLAAADDQVVARVAADPNFRNPLGQFDRDLMRRALARANMTEGEFLRIEKSNMVRSQMAEGLSGGMTAPTLLVNPLMRWREEKRVAEAVIIKDDSLPLPAAPDNVQLEAYYKDHAQRFVAPEFRAVTVLLAKPADVAPQVEVTSDMVADAYQARSDEFQTPERRQVAQLVLADQVAADKAGQLVAAGKDLTAVAKEMNGKVVDLGIVEKRDLPDELADAVFGLRQGATSQPVRTPLGWHVAQVTKITAGHVRTLAEVKGQIEADLRRDKAMDKLSEMANQIEDALGGGATLEEAASRFSLRVLKVPAMDAQGKTPAGKPVAELPKGETFLDVAFHTDQGTESQLTEVEGDGYFLLRVDQVTPPQPKPFLEVKGEVLAAWQAERRHEQAKERAEKMAELFKTGKPAAEIAAALGAKIQTTQPFTREGADTAGLPPALVSDLFNASAGGVASSATQGGWVVGRLAKVIPFDPAQQPRDSDAAQRRISAAVAGDLVDQYLAALNASIGVKVDRSQLAREE
ncbi:MAG: peptidyl-prolyl cis-trans isomerase [Rhodospirillaceae bacterium]|nr:peptidyl-prolyl cis-trans isomerase [Rhodospirillales bacterium]